MPPARLALSLRLVLATALATALANGCAPDLRPPADSSADADVEAGDGAVGKVHTEVIHGVATATLNAESSESWVYVDLDAGFKEVAVGDGWDVAFQRFKVMSNGGVSGAGGVEVAQVDPGTFEGVTTVPTAGWLTDLPDGPDNNGDPDYAFSQGMGWFAYNPDDHALTPREIVYVVKTTARRTFKLKFVNYYDTAGTSGFPKLQWAELTAQ